MFVIIPTVNEHDRWVADYDLFPDVGEGSLVIGDID